MVSTNVVDNEKGTYVSARRPEQMKKTHRRNSSNSGNSRAPAGSKGPSISLRCSQSKPLNQGWVMTCLNPFVNSVVPVAGLPILFSGPANKHERKSIHSLDNCDLISGGICRIIMEQQETEETKEETIGKNTTQ